MMMMVSAFFHIAIYLIAAGIISSQVDITNPEILKRIIPVWILIAILAVLGFLLFNLISLHIYLQYKGLTTF